MSRPPLHDVAHLGYLELLTPEFDKSLWFFTDVLGAKLLGMRAIYVQPIDRREFPTTRFLRLLERPVFWRLRVASSRDRA